MGIVLNKTAQQLATWAYNDFWKTIKSLRGNENVAAKVIDGNCTDETIAKHFCSIYCTIYNSVKNTNLNATSLKINELVRSKCSKNLCNSKCHNVTSEKIKNAIKCLNSGKNDENYNIYSDNFIHATELTHKILSQLVTAMLIHGTADELMNKASIKPIQKTNRNHFQ